MQLYRQRLPGGHTLVRFHFRVFPPSVPGEVDAEIAAADAVEETAKQAWLRERQLLAG